MPRKSSGSPAQFLAAAKFLPAAGRQFSPANRRLNDFRFARETKSWEPSSGCSRSERHRIATNMDAWKLLRIAAFAVPLTGLPAQEASPAPGQVQRDFWRAELPGGEYLVRLSAITSVSLQEYVLDGTARVTEVKVATSGSDLARFYFLEPFLPKPPTAPAQRTLDAVENKVKEVSARVETGDLKTKVVKNYPATTHAHTAEYRLADRESLNKLFRSVSNAWTSGRGGSFKP